MSSKLDISKNAERFFDAIHSLSITLKSIDDIFNCEGISFIVDCLKYPQLFMSFSQKWSECLKKLESQENIRKREQINTLLIFIMAGTKIYLDEMKELKVFLLDKNASLTVTKENLDRFYTFAKVVKYKAIDRNPVKSIIEKTITFVKNQDCLDMARDLVAKGYHKVAVLSMGSNLKIGGRWEMGSQGQVN